MAIPSVFPMFLKAAETQAITGTIILNGLDVSVGDELSVTLGGDLDVSVGLSMPVPVDPGELAVSIENELSIEVESCDG